MCRNFCPAASGLDTINSVLPGPDGCIYVLGGSSLLVLGRNLEPQLTLEDENLQGDLVPCGNGSIAVTSLDDGNNRVLKLVDRPGGKWGKEYVLPSNAYSVYPGSGEFLFLYENGDSLYGMREQGQEAEKLLSWSAVDINRDNVLSFCILEDGRIAALNRSEDTGLELVQTELFFQGDKTAEQAAEIIQNRVSLYVSERI